jgi:hypothetical protein
MQIQHILMQKSRQETSTLSIKAHWEFQGVVSGMIHGEGVED